MPPTRPPSPIPRQAQAKLLLYVRDGNCSSTYAPSVFRSNRDCPNASDGIRASVPHADSGERLRGEPLLLPLSQRGRAARAERLGRFPQPGAKLTERVRDTKLAPERPKAALRRRRG